MSREHFVNRLLEMSGSQPLPLDNIAGVAVSWRLELSSWTILGNTEIPCIALTCAYIRQWLPLASYNDGAAVTKSEIPSTLYLTFSTICMLVFICMNGRKSGEFSIPVQKIPDIVIFTCLFYSSFDYFSSKNTKYHYSNFLRQAWNSAPCSAVRWSHILSCHSVQWRLREPSGTLCLVPFQLASDSCWFLSRPGDDTSAAWRARAQWSRLPSVRSGAHVYIQRAPCPSA